MFIIFFHTANNYINTTDNKKKYTFQEKKYNKFYSQNFFV